MLTANGDRWHYNTTRLVVWNDALEYRFGKKNVGWGMTGVMLGSFAIAMATFMVFSDILTSYYGAPLVVSITAFLIFISIPLLGMFTQPVDLPWTTFRMNTSYTLQLLLSPEILKDRKAMWRFRKEIDGFLLVNGVLVRDTVELGATPSCRDSIYERRGEIQLKAMKLAEMMGHSGPEFDLHMAKVNREVYQLEILEIERSLTRLKAERESFAGSIQQRLASYDADIAAFEQLSSAVNR